MKKFLSVALMIFTLMFCMGCGGNTYTHLTPEEAQKIMKSVPNALVLDVRTKEEYDKRHIFNAVLLPLDDLIAGDFSKVPDKNQTILIYCWSGRRAVDAAEILIKHGYKKVYEFGGLIDWKGSLSGNNSK